jgi:hypothetical protein
MTINSDTQKEIKTSFVEAKHIANNTKNFINLKEKTSLKIF